MTVTLEIPPAMASILSAKAELFGLALPDYLFSLLETNVDDYFSLSVEEIVAVQQGLADVEAGDKGISLEEFGAEMDAKIALRKQQKAEDAT